jgi:putative membrane protein
MKGSNKEDKMKPSFCALVFFSSSLLIVSSCSDHSKPTHAVQEQQLGESQIINIMMTVDKGEIAAAQEATKKKVMPSVDLYAKYLIQQHQRNLEALTQLAKQLGIEPKESVISNSIAISGKHDLKTLGELQDKAFDKGFIDTMVKEHQEGLELIDTKLLPQTKNTQLKAFVEQFRNMVSDHLEKGLQIQRTL